jgi:hypothetical protein
MVVDASARPKSLAMQIDEKQAPAHTHTSERVEKNKQTSKRAMSSTNTQTGE